MAARWMLVIVVGGVIGISGCGDAQTVQPAAAAKPLKSAGESLTEAEMQQFLRLIARLPDGQVPEFTPFEQPQLDTLLPAKMLITEFRSRYRDLCDPQRQGQVWDANLDLAKPAQQEGWTSAQLASFIRCLSCAVVKQRLTKKHDLKKIEQQCRQEISKVVATLDRDDQRPRSQMTEAFMQEREQRVHQLARMVAMLEFMLQLKSVPQSNLELVQKYDAQIRPLLPQASTQDPFVEPFAEVPVDRQAVVPVGYQAN
jgi:hypothetical protein